MVFGGRKLLPTLAHPSDLAGGDSGHQCISGDIFCDHSSGSDKGVLANGIAADDCAVGPKACAFFYEGFFVFVFSGDSTSGVNDVCKNHTRAAEDIVFQLHLIIDGDVVLHFDIGADFDVIAHVDVLPERAVFADFDVTAADVHPVPNARAGADFSAFVDNGSRMGFIVHKCGSSVLFRSAIKYGSRVTSLHIFLPYTRQSERLSH